MSDLRTLLDDLVSRSALPASSVSTAALTGYFPGLTISDRTRLRDVIEEVQGLLQFDAITSGNALRFSHRGRASMLAIPEADLMPLKPGSGDTLLLTRLAADALPEQLDVVYADAARDYQPVTQRAQRQITEGQKTDTVRFGGVLNASQARRAAQILLDTALQERTRYQFTLPAKYLALEPGDVVTLTVKNQ
ncbi:MAG: phage tail protein, partial [Holosporales bacterium]